MDDPLGPDREAPRGLTKCATAASRTYGPLAGVAGRSSPPGEGLLVHARAAIVVCDATGAVTFATPHARRLLGTDPLGVSLAGFATAESRPGLEARLAQAAGASDADDSVFGDFVTGSDPPRVLEFEVSGPAPRQGLAGPVVVLHDVTQHHQRAADLLDRAMHDPLTGLANHAAFSDRLAQQTRREDPGMLALIDLDHFKRVNDEHGHAGGDMVLVAVARRLRSAISGEAAVSVARIGGEEFAVLLPGQGTGDAEALVTRMLTAIAEPVGHIGVVTASAGLARVPQADEAGSRSAAASEAQRTADEALYLAKSSGRARLLVYGPELVSARRRIRRTVEALQRENADLSEQARTDALTGIGNRRRFDEDLAAVAAAAERRGLPYSVVFIDLDEFGAVNKVWHDQAGDRTLADAATTLAGAVRESDRLYRYGGEEFAALLPGASRRGALSLCERMRAALAERAIEHPTRGKITASIGLASSADCREGPASVVAAAIAAMREAKATGRDRIVVSHRRG